MTIFTLPELKDFLKIPADRTDDDAVLELARGSGHGGVRQITGRSWEKETTATARVFAAESPYCAWVDDFWSTTDLVIKTDDSDDATFGTTWTAAQYELHPLNGRLQGETWSYCRVEAVSSRFFPVQNQHRATVQVTAKWGWSVVPDDVRLAGMILAASDERVRDLVRGEGGFTRWSREHAEALLARFVHPTRAAQGIA